MTYDPRQYQPPPQGYQQPPAPPQGYLPQPGWQQPPPPEAPPPGFPPPTKPKSSKGPAIVIGVVAVLAVCVSVAASGGGDTGPTSSAAVSTPGATAAKAKGATEKAPAGSTFSVPAGSVITAKDGRDVQTAVLRSVKTFKRGCSSLDVNPEQGMYVVVDLLVTQKSGAGTVNPLDFEFVADDGTTANALSAVFSGCAEPSLSSSKLRAGQKRSGKIAFDVGMKAGAVEWAPGGLGSDTVGSWATK